MLLEKISLLVVALGVSYFAVKEKAFWNMRRNAEGIPSPLSKALVQLLAIAGGIYLALVSLATFIGLEVPEKIQVYGIGCDPIASIAFVLAFLQPFTQRIHNFLRKKVSWK